MGTFAGIGACGLRERRCVADGGATGHQWNLPGRAGGVVCPHYSEIWHVVLLREKSELTVYTGSKEKLSGVIGQVLVKESAIEAVEKTLGKGKELEIGRLSLAI